MPIESSQAPAATLHHFAGVAREEVDPGLAKATCKQNASRDAHAFIRKWGLAWKVPMSYADHLEDGVTMKIPFLSPKSWVKFLLEKHQIWFLEDVNTKMKDGLTSKLFGQHTPKSTPPIGL